MLSKKQKTKCQYINAILKLRPTYKKYLLWEATREELKEMYKMLKKA